MGPVDEAGALLETWITLEDQGDGRWRGSASRRFDAAETYALRAVATVGGETHNSPEQDFAVVDNDVEESVAEINALLDAAEDAQLAESDPGAGLLAAQRVLAADPRVLATVVSPDAQSVEAIWANGIHFRLLGPQDGYKGGGSLGGLTYEGALVARTGVSTLVRGYVQPTENNNFVVLSPWASDFGDFESGPELMRMAGETTCPEVGTATNPTDTAARFGASSAPSPTVSPRSLG